LGEKTVSYKVSVDSVAEADGDDVLVALIDILFRQSSFRSWLIFVVALSAPIGMTVAFWVADRFLGAAVFSMVALLVVIGRIIGSHRERPAEEMNQNRATPARTSREPVEREAAVWTPTASVGHTPAR
jgi:hypothetical protein